TPAGPRPWSSSPSYGGTRFSPSKISSSADGGSSSAAARRSAVLWESRRRLPEIPSTFIVLRLLLDELEMDTQRHLVAEHLAAVGQLHVPVEPVVVAVDLGLQVESEPLVLVRSDGRAGELALGDDRLGDALDGQLSVDRELVALAGDRGRLEADLRGPVPVEELGGEEVGLEVLLLHLDALDGDPAG